MQTPVSGERNARLSQLLEVGYGIGPTEKNGEHTLRFQNRIGSGSSARGILIK
jgi:hypothetical protein